jgi:hypothetical protein
MLGSIKINRLLTYKKLSAISAHIKEVMGAMKHKESEAEYANKKINQFFYGENDNDNTTIDMDPLINNNNISLVVSSPNKQDDKI